MQVEPNQPTRAHTHDADAQVHLDAEIERWSFELGLTRGFLPQDPMNAVDWTRRIQSEMAAEVERNPAAAEALAPIRGELDNLLEQSCEAQRRFLDDSARRERTFEAREHNMRFRTLDQLRQPWPGR